MAVTSLGQISAIFKGTSAPTNTNMIWQDTSVTPHVFKSYDSISSSWVALNISVGGAVTVASDDKVVIQDTSDSDNYKTVTAQSIADLGGATVINNDANNRITTALGNGELNAESNLTFDGTILRTGQIAVGSVSGTNPILAMTSNNIDCSIANNSQSLRLRIDASSGDSGSIPAIQIGGPGNIVNRPLVGWVNNSAYIATLNNNGDWDYQGHANTNISQIGLTEQSADPTNPLEGNSVIWQSDGTDTGSDGDILIKRQYGASVRTHEVALVETGIFTPEIADAATGGNVASITINEASYSRVGNQVTVHIDISISSTAGMTGANNMFLRSFPYSIAYSTTSPVSLRDVTFSGYVNLYNDITDTDFLVFRETVSASSAISNLIVSDFDTTSALHTSFTYITSDSWQ